MGALLIYFSKSALKGDLDKMVRQTSMGGWGTVCHAAMTSLSQGDDLGGWAEVFTVSTGDLTPVHTGSAHPWNPLKSFSQLTRLPPRRLDFFNEETPLMALIC